MQHEKINYGKKCISCGKKIENNLINEKYELVKDKSIEIEKFGHLTTTTVISFHFPLFCKKCLNLDIMRRLGVYVNWLEIR